MRKEEILSLESEKHIDLRHGIILFDKTKNGDRREIPINQTLRETLQRSHDLRHTFTSHLVMAGIDTTMVKEFLGHKTLTMTLRYAHLAPAHKVKAVEILYGAMNETQLYKNYTMKQKRS